MSKSRENVVDEFKAILNQGAQFAARGTQDDAGLDYPRQSGKTNPIVAAALEAEASPFNVMADPEDLGLNIKAFDVEDDELNMTREEMLAQLGEGEKLVRAQVKVDALTGEKSIVPVREDDETAPESLADIQPPTPEEVRKQFSAIARQNILLLIPSDTPDAEVDKLVTKLEDTVGSLTRNEITNLGDEQVKTILGDVLYKGITQFNPKPIKAAKAFLLDLKASITESNSIINAIDEVNASMKFFQEAGINDMELEIKASMEGEDTYPTPLHHYKEYLKRYVERLKSDPLHFTNRFVQTEIETCESRIKALDEAFSFHRIIEKGFNLKSKIQKDFKDKKMVARAIHDFVGKLNNDPSFVVQFPVPKNISDKQATPQYLTSVWMMFIAMLETYRMFPVLDEISYLDYGDMANIVTGQTKVEYNEEGEPFDERLHNLKLFAEKHSITKSHLRQAESFATVFCYVMARAYKPTELTDTYNKYVVSFTMSILTQSMNVRYREFTHAAFAEFYRVLTP
jgi:hypothetical protein